MNFAYSKRCEDLRARLTDFMESEVYPSESEHEAQRANAPFEITPALHRLKAEAYGRELWNLFLPDPDLGVGLKNVEYAPLAEITGRSIGLAPEATNCSAPDTGNMELLLDFGSAEQKEQWLTPLLEGKVRSCFAMTEPAVASSDPRNLKTSIVRDGNHYVVNGRKWWASGAAGSDCKVSILMGVTDPDASPRSRYSMILVPMDAPGVHIERSLNVFGYSERGGHGVVTYRDVRVPASSLIAGEGGGYMIAQARLGPGRIHHCMRLIGMAERAFDLMVERARSRIAFGSRISDKGLIRDWIAEARWRIEQARLLVLKTAWMLDEMGNREARREISSIKVVAPRTALWVIDRAIQVHGGAGVSNDVPLARMWAHARVLRIADGPDEVHNMVLARRELNRYDER